MTLLIIFLLSCISTYLILKILATLLDIDIKNLLIFDNEIYVLFQSIGVIIMTFTFLMMYLCYFIGQ